MLIRNYSSPNNFVKFAPVPIVPERYTQSIALGAPYHGVKAING